nr:MAG TPA: hypothetical protein [Caudoviricetes sp.]
MVSVRNRQIHTGVRAKAGALFVCKNEVLRWSGATISNASTTKWSCAATND